MKNKNMVKVLVPALLGIFVSSSALAKNIPDNMLEFYAKRYCVDVQEKTELILDYRLEGVSEDSVITTIALSAVSQGEISNPVDTGLQILLTELVYDLSEEEMSKEKDNILESLKEESTEKCIKAFVTFNKKENN